MRAPSRVYRLLVDWALPRWMRSAWGDDLIATFEARRGEIGGCGWPRRLSFWLQETGSLARVAAAGRVRRRRIRIDDRYTQTPEGKPFRIRRPPHDTRSLRVAWVIAISVHFGLFTAVWPVGDRVVEARPRHALVVIRRLPPSPPPERKIERRPVRRDAPLVPIPDPTPDEPEIIIELPDFEPTLTDVADLVFVGIPVPVPPQPAPEPIPEPVPEPSVYRGGVDVERPRLVASPQPQYSDLARWARLECTVVLEAMIGVQGRVADLHVVEPCRLGLTDAAVVAVSQWRYEPTLVNGRRVPVSVRVTVRFHLD